MKRFFYTLEGNRPVTANKKLQCRTKDRIKSFDLLSRKEITEM
jgi:hypothetical protein